METIFRATLFLAGTVNMLPSLLTFMPHRIAASYGIEAPDSNLELLLRHRAVLFGIIGGMMIYSSIAQKYYDLVTLAGLASMISFILLYFLINTDGISKELRGVMIIDAIATILLVTGWVLYSLR
jgi:hypothetical protein